MTGYKKFIPGIAWFFFVLILICLPGDDLPHPDDWMSVIMFDKWVHFGLFSVLTFLFMRPVAVSSLTKQSRSNILWKLAVSVSIWGLTTEFIQKFFIPGRSFDLADWAADTAGALAALIFCYRFYLKSE